MAFFLGLMCYLAGAAALIGAGLFGLAVLLEPPAMPERVAGSNGAEPPAVALQPGEHRSADTAPTDPEFRHGPKIDYGRGTAAMRRSRQALEEARSARAQERVATRKRVRDRLEVAPVEAPVTRFEYPPERPSGH